MITLSAATPADVSEIAAIAAEMDQFYGDDGTYEPGARQAQIYAALFGDPPAAHALLAREEGTVTGFAAYSFLWPAVGVTSSLYLKELYVTEAARRTGTGQAIMRELFAIAAGRGCSRVEWTTDADNPGAQAFYAALGVAPVASKVFYRVGGEDLAKAAAALG